MRRKNNTNWTLILVFTLTISFALLYFVTIKILDTPQADKDLIQENEELKALLSNAKVKAWETNTFWIFFMLITGGIILYYMKNNKKGNVNTMKIEKFEKLSKQWLVKNFNYEVKWQVTEAWHRREGSPFTIYVGAFGKNPKPAGWKGMTTGIFYIVCLNTDFETKRIPLGEGYTFDQVFEKIRDREIIGFSPQKADDPETVERFFELAAKQKAYEDTFGITRGN